MKFASRLVCLLSLATFIGCSFEMDPATTVKLEITGISQADDREAVSDQLKNMTDGSSHMMTSTYSGDKLTVQLSPVSDVDAFSKKINFGTVTEIKDRTVKIVYSTKE